MVYINPISSSWYSHLDCLYMIEILHDNLVYTKCQRSLCQGNRMRIELICNVYTCEDVLHDIHRLWVISLRAPDLDDKKSILSWPYL